jgi:hypothetical protein
MIVALILAIIVFFIFLIVLALIVLIIILVIFIWQVLLHKERGVNGAAGCRRAGPCSG